MKKGTKRIVVLLVVLSLILPLITLQASALNYSGSSSYKSGKYYTKLKNVKLTGDQRTDIVNVARSQVGYQEGSSSSQLAGTSYGGKNYTEYGRWYGLQDMWCAMFVSWCANAAGISTSIVPKHSYTPTGLQWFKDRGRAYSRATVAKGGYTPKPGDIIYFKSSRNSNSTNHIGIVTKYSNGTVYTIEGNTSSATISTNGGAVCEKSYSISNTYIVYICNPAYKNTSSGSSSSSSSATYWLDGAVKDIVFDPVYYANNYEDLKKAFGSDATKLFEHFLNYGIKEGRTASPIFSIKYYTEKNADLKKAFGTDYVAAMKHFIRYGINEARVTKEPVNLGDKFQARIGYPKGGLNLSLSETNVIVYTPSDKPAQVWTFKRHSSGAYSIINTKNGYYLTADGKTSGSNISIAKNNDSDKQLWYIYNTSDGKYVLRSKAASGCVVDVKGGATSSLTNVLAYNYNATTAQQFTINKVTSTSTPAVSEVKYVDLGTDFYAKIQATSGKNLSLSDSNVIIYGNSSAPAQVWKFVRNTDGSYKIINQKTGECLDVSGAVDKSGTNVCIYKDNNTNAQKWFIYKEGDKYIFQPACSKDCVLDVYANSSKDLTNVQIYTKNGSDAQKFSIVPVDASQVTSSNNMKVLRKIMYAVETGGEVYGKCDYADFTQAYTNTPEEHAITIGAGQWYGPEAKTLLNTIRKADPALFAQLDTAGIAYDLDNANWSTYKLSKTSAKAKCIKAIISSSVGIKCQDQLMDKQLAKYMKEAADLGVTDVKAQMMCANIRHLGGLSAVKRVLNKTSKPYTVDSIYNAMKSDTGNQVGTFKSRNLMVYNAINKYVK